MGKERETTLKGRDAQTGRFIKVRDARKRPPGGGPSVSAPGTRRARPHELPFGARSTHRTAVATPKGRRQRPRFPLLATPSPRYNPHTSCARGV